MTISFVLLSIVCQTYYHDHWWLERQGGVLWGINRHLRSQQEKHC